MKFFCIKKPCVRIVYTICIFTICILSYIIVQKTLFASELNSSYVNIKGKVTKNTELLSHIKLSFDIDSDWELYSASEENNSFGIPLQIQYFREDVPNINWPKAILKATELGNTIYSSYIYQNNLEIKFTLPKEKSFEFNIIGSVCNDVCIPIQHKILVENTEANSTSNSIDILELLHYILYAIFAGLLLNIMPCILPVLSLKLTSITKTSPTLKERRKIFLFTAVGIIFSFACFGVLFASISNFILGTHLQNPFFLSILLLILIILFLTFIGVSHISQVDDAGNKVFYYFDNKFSQFPNFKHFLNGALITLIGTSCLTPFLGALLTHVMAQGYTAPMIILIFTMVGVGTALPYIILTFYKKEFRFTSSLKKYIRIIRIILGAGLALTIIWLIFILYAQIIWATAIIIAIVLAAAYFAKYFGLLSLLAGIGISYCVISYIEPLIDAQREIEQESHHFWKNFSDEQYASYKQENSPFILLVTADWCVTCKLNEINVIYQEDIIKLLQEQNIAGLKIDITKANSEYADIANKLLKEHNQAGIPLAILYRNGKTNLFPIILTESNFRAILELN